MPKFKVAVWEEQSGYLYIEAVDEAEAEEKAEAYLEENGIDDGVDVQHRSTEILGEPITKVE
jgi:hypothetical protein